MADIYLAINRCPKHPKVYSIAVEQLDGCGTRITPEKCCGTWNEFKRWKLTSADVERITNVLEDELEDAQHATD